MLVNDCLTWLCILLTVLYPEFWAGFFYCDLVTCDWKWYKRILSVWFILRWLCSYRVFFKFLSSTPPPISIHALTHTCTQAHSLFLTSSLAFFIPASNFYSLLIHCHYHRHTLSYHYTHTHCDYYYLCFDFDSSLNWVVTGAFYST